MLWKWSSPLESQWRQSRFMKIVFMGTPQFAVESLKALVENKHEISAVVTVPDSPRGRGLKMQSSAVKEFAEGHNFPILQPEILKDEKLISKLKFLNADCFVVVAFKILPKEIFTIPKYGTVNVHASLLPAYRGAAPINWAIINGEKKTGVTTMFIDTKVDTGNILKQTEVLIKVEMNAGELYDLLAQEGANLLVETISLIERNDITPIKQDETKATKAPKINNDVALIDFFKPALNVNNLIRGLSPYPAAYSFLNGKKVKVFKSRVVPAAKGEPGVIKEISSSSFTVKCLDGGIEVLELQIEGKKRMLTKAFLNGFNLKVGNRFTKSF